MATTTLVRNIAGHDLREDFPFYGIVEVAKDAVGRIPEDVAQAWENPVRNSGRALIERVSDETVIAAAPKKGRGKKGAEPTVAPETDPDLDSDDAVDLT